MSDSKAKFNDTKRVFLKKGTCSRTLFYILNREFDNSLEAEEIAADPLHGGIMQQGYQCGFLWGAAMGVGAETFRRNDDLGQAIGIAILAAKQLVESFVNRTKSVECYDLTEANFSSKLGLAKFLVTGKFLSCFKLADKWVPEAIKAATEGLAQDQTDLLQHSVSCASEVVKKMGATDQEMLIVAGFAGGIGLSGNACGALSAAIWVNTLAWDKEHPGKSNYPNSKATNTLEAFLVETDYEFRCDNICGRSFQTIDEHTEYIKNGGCAKLIDVLAQS